MNRRDLIGLAAVAPLVGGSVLGAAAPALASMGRPPNRPRPGEPGWPNPGAFTVLGRSLSGHLVEPKPLLGPCETDLKSDACKARFKNLQNPFFIGDQAAGTQVSGYLDAWTPALSYNAVIAHDSHDVAATVRFARRFNLRLVVKGGAHSYHGTSNAPDSILIWMRAMRAVQVIDAFTPSGAPAGTAAVPAVSAEGGALWIDLYDAVTTKGGRYVQGGGCTTVGVAGHIQSGGFGSFSKGWGLSSGSLLEAEVVTADGEIRTVNPWREPDLFWALKGGGGGSLGVVTKVVLRTHDLPAEFGAAGGRVKAADEAAFRRLVDRFLAFYAEALLNPHWGEQASIQKDNVLKISMVSQGVSEGEAARVWAPFFDWVKASPADYHFESGPYVHAGKARDWWNVEGMRREKSTSMHYDDRPGAPATHGWWSGDQDQVGAYLHGYDSIWLPADLLAPANRARLAGALVDASRHFAVDLHFNKGLAGATPEAIAGARDTAMNPDVLSAFALAIIATGGLPAYMSLVGLKPDSDYAHKNAAAVAASAATVRVLAPDGGTYLSESNFFNENWRRDYWGGNYGRLRRVKTKYDPDCLFFVHHGVGSEAWSADGFTRATLRAT